MNAISGRSREREFGALSSPDNSRGEVYVDAEFLQQLQRSNPHLGIVHFLEPAGIATRLFFMIASVAAPFLLHGLWTPVAVISIVGVWVASHLLRSTILDPDLSLRAGV